MKKSEIKRGEDICQMLANEIDRDKIAYSIGVSLRTVESIISKMKALHGMQTTPGLIAKLFRLKKIK